MTVALLGGVALVGVAAWVRPLAEGERARREGRLDGALERYAAAESRFDRVPMSKQLLSTAYQAGQATQLWLLYRLEQYDAVIEKASVSPPVSITHFWTACAFFEKARLEEQPEARIGWLSRAEEEFRNVLELDPDDWDAKFNYELTRRLLAELRKQPKTPPSQLLQLLRPQPKEGAPQRRRTG